MIRADRSAALPWALLPAAGLAQAVSIATPWSGRPLWWLQVASLALLAWCIAQPIEVKSVLLRTWLFATVWLTGTFWWLFISMHTYGGLPAPLAAVAVLALAAFLGGYYALAMAFWRWRSPAGPLRSIASFAALWLLAELLRGRWFTGFPWGAGGYAHVDGPLAFLAPWIGVYGIGAVAAAIAAALSFLPQAWRSRRYWLAAGVWVLLLAACTQIAPTHDEAAGAPLPVTLLQGNIPQDEKFEGRTGVPLALQWYAEQLTAARTSLVVAPETAIPLLPQQLPEGYLQSLAEHFGRGEQASLIGIPLGSYEQGYTNSVVGLKPGADAYRFDKHHLVPFGEFIPPLFRWFTDLMNIPLGDFNRGSVGQPSFEWQGQRLAPNVCYEDLFGEELAARFVDPRLAPTIFVNVSNIGWFGNTVAIDQHLHISRMRALEFARPVIRATNTGATAIIDHRARVTHSLAPHTRDVLTGEVSGRAGTTPFAWWASRLGLWPLWLLALAPVLGALPRLRRRAGT
ncbi:apolipoprotein N-acyltransferase [Ramlibacter henchirensis]|uniref:Apolipoprotein N-acyltransferase n=1 Tax=Ramlibacter henchirensis TaxID=204072 RepID=A0A4Z0C673_9BURK|nr:apolipoprotein N-acyltransferase [Ramlibacter henchirensis]TFZ07113.1 apolipoprotein N-acyltransferase [Ramlibacter henchirensis]